VVQLLRTHPLEFLRRVRAVRAFQAFLGVREVLSFLVGLEVLHLVRCLADPAILVLPLVRVFLGALVVLLGMVCMESEWEVDDKHRRSIFRSCPAYQLILDDPVFLGLLGDQQVQQIRVGSSFESILVPVAEHKWRS